MQTTLYLMLGYPGAGKTTVAKLISNITGAVHLWADQERLEQFKHPSFTKEENLRLYNAMNQEAENLLANGQSVVFDTAFNHYADREKLRKLAETQGAEVVVVWVQTEREVAEQRALASGGKDPHRKLDHHMTHADFQRLSDKLEEPQDDEAVIAIDGTKVTKEHVEQKLHES